MKIPNISRRQFVQVAGAAATTQFPLRGADAPTDKAIVHHELVVEESEAQPQHVLHFG